MSKTGLPGSTLAWFESERAEDAPDGSSDHDRVLLVFDDLFAHPACSGILWLVLTSGWPTREIRR